MALQKHHFGDLEQAIMDVIWKQQNATVRDVVDALRQRRIAYTTVMTVMNRLASHRILHRASGQSGAFVYRARLTREDWCTEASRIAIDDIVRRYGAVAMAQFVDRLDRVPSDKLAALRRQVRKGSRR